MRVQSKWTLQISYTVCFLMTRVVRLCVNSTDFLTKVRICLLHERIATRTICNISAYIDTLPIMGSKLTGVCAESNSVFFAAADGYSVSAYIIVAGNDQSQTAVLTLLTKLATKSSLITI